MEDQSYRDNYTSKTLVLKNKTTCNHRHVSVYQLYRRLVLAYYNSILPLLKTQMQNDKLYQFVPYCMRAGRSTQ